MFGRTMATISEALTPIIIIRMLSKTDVGLLSGAMVIYSTAALILSTGYPATLFYFLPTRDAVGRGALARRMTFVLAVVGALLGALFWLAGHLPADSGLTSSTGVFDPEALSLLSALALYPVGDLPSRMLPNLLVIEERTRAAAVFGIVKAVGMSAATIVPVLAGGSLATILWCVSGFGLLQGLMLLYVLRKLYPGPRGARSDVGVGEMTRFSVPLGLTDVVSMLNARLDRYLIGLSFPASAFAEYHAGAFQVPVINDIAYAVGRVYASDFTRLFQAGRAREAIAQWRLSIHKVALLVVPLASIFIVAAEEFIQLLFTDAYLHAASIFRLYSLTMLGRVAAFGSVIVAAGKPRLVAHAALFTLLSNAVISVPCLFAFDFVGPALGTAIAFVPMVWYYCRCIAKATDLRVSETFPLFDYCRVLALGALAATPAVLFKVNVSMNPIFKLLIIAALILVCFGALGTALGFISNDDWRFVRRFLRGRFSSA